MPYFECQFASMLMKLCRQIAPHDLEHVGDLVAWSKNARPFRSDGAVFRHFFTFFQLRSPTMCLQKGKKLTKNSSFLPQAPNPQHALTNATLLLHLTTVDSENCCTFPPEYVLINTELCYYYRAEMIHKGLRRR